MSLQWGHNELDGVSNHQPRHCLLSRSYGRRSKKTSKHRVTGPCAGNSPGTGEFPAQMASNAENVSIGWRYHVGSSCRTAKKMMICTNPMTFERRLIVSCFCFSKSRMTSWNISVDDVFYLNTFYDYFRRTDQWVNGYNCILVPSAV